MYSWEFCCLVLLALICTAGVLAFIYLKHQKSGESCKKASEANDYQALPHDILHRIFVLWDDPRDLQRAGATCKAWRNARKNFVSVPVKSLKLKECDESGTEPQKDISCAIHFQGGKPNGGVLKEERIGCSSVKDQENTSSKTPGNVPRADGTNLTFSDATMSPPVEFLKTGGFIFDRTEDFLDQSVDDYIQDNPVVKPYVLYDKTEVCLSTDDGISLWLGFITLLIMTFEAGKSWGGAFELHHLRMKNGKDCNINMPPACLGTFPNLLLDLAKLAKLLFGYFSDKKHNPALYIHALYNCMVFPKVGSKSSRQDQLRYLKYLRNHLAFSTAARRSALFKAIYQAFKSMVGDERKNFLDVLVRVTLVKSWRTLARGHQLLLKVLTFKMDDPSNTAVLYGKTLKEFIRFLRNFFEHGSVHTIVNGQQLMENVEELDYIAGTNFSISIPDMLYTLVMQLDMAGGLQIPWNNYCS